MSPLYKTPLKRPFVLLELLIAFALVSISALPFIRYPLQHLRSEVSNLYVMELEREIDKELAKLQIKLISEPVEGEKEILLHARLTPDMSRSFKGKITVKRTGHKIDKEERECLLMTAKVEVQGPHKTPIRTERTFFILP
ncbi:MAG: hypothetical protein K940chlam2_00241 [Chlamydiae bacterium]|nr:hypothetical protein [Chlamydiota bacterium]